MNISVKKLATRVSLVLATAALLVPVSISPDQGVTSNEACAGDSCCKELMSLCGLDDPLWDHYDSNGTSCRTLEFQ